MKILNLYAGVGGNRLHWKGHHITAVESNEKIAAIYKKQFPDDTVIVGDAKQYLLSNYKQFNFVWASPPCQENSRLQRARCAPGFPDLSVYELFIFLNTHFQGKFLVENVEPFYKPLIEPQRLGRHCFWANFRLPSIVAPSIDLINATVPELLQWLGFEKSMKLAPYRTGSNYSQVLRNCVHPVIGAAILEKVTGVFDISKYRPGLLFSD